MSIYAKGSFSGDYEPRGDVSSADVVIAHSFGVGENGQPGVVNEALADFINERYPHLPALAHESIAVALDVQPVASLEGDPTNTLGKGLGTRGELVQARAYMDKEGLHDALLVGQAFHIGRVAWQACQLDMDVIIPEELPTVFDPHSQQWWTRSQGLWILREALAAPVLHYEESKLLRG